MRHGMIYYHQTITQTVKRGGERTHGLGYLYRFPIRAKYLTKHRMNKHQSGWRANGGTSIMEERERFAMFLLAFSLSWIPSIIAAWIMRG